MRLLEKFFSGVLLISTGGENMNTILFLPNQKKCQASDGSKLLEIAAKNGIMIDASCAGNGTCGKCKVIVLESEKVSPVTQEEKNLLSEKEIANGVRLACALRVEGNMVIEIPDTNGSSERKKKMNKMPDNFKFGSAVTKQYIKLAKATLGEQTNDLDRIRNSMENPDMLVKYPMLPYIQKAIAQKRGKITAVLKENRLLTVEPEDTSDILYGVAFDIGTTTIVGILWDLKNKIMVDLEADTNPQSVFGADVISRIQYCMEDEENTKKMQEKVIDCCNSMIIKFCERNNLTEDAIYDAIVVGNTTMSHLLLGVNPVNLSRIPFAPAFCEAVTVDADRIGMRINPCAEVYVLPNIAGHVGSDITAVMLATNLFSLRGNVIAIDIGTNGEILASSDGRICACSTAAGPAFEGACIHDGMRAAKGAIEGISIEQDITLKIIDSDEPVGICGSGLIEAVSELLRVGLITDKGNLISKAQAQEMKIPEAVCDRLFGEGTDAGVVLYRKENGDTISLMQQDIREVQLAKGAILGGMLTLMKELDFTVEEIDRIIIAGAFGSYIDKESAVRIGLLPSIELDKIESIGNGAGIGASMALLSSETRNIAEEQVKRIKHVELSQNMDFQDYYVKSMLF